MLQIDPKQVTTVELQKLLQGGIAPRPIALVSTVSSKGQVNLSPFSFFNVFSSNPPIVGFSPARRGRDASLKDTYHNIMETGECVIQAVTYDMVQQVSLASTEYEPGINEFIKSGLTPAESIMVKPPRVQGSPFQMECKLSQMIHLGTGGGAGNLALCEVVLLHVNESVFHGNIIDPHKIDLVARMSGDFYCRASGASVFEVEKPLLKKGIGFDLLPEHIRNLKLLTGNELGKLANVEQIPNMEDAELFKTMLLEKYLFAPDENTDLNSAIQQENYELAAVVLLSRTGTNTTDSKDFVNVAKCALQMNAVLHAWYILLLMQ